MLRYAPLLIAVKLFSSLPADPVIVDKYNALKKKYRTPKYPIVLCHGLSGFDKLVILPPLVSLKADNESVLGRMQSPGGVYFDYWRGITDALEAEGCTVIVTKVPPFGSIQQRATALNECIEAKIRELKIRENADADRLYNNNETGTVEKVKINLIAHSMGGLDSRYLISQIEQTHYEVMTLTTVATPHHGSSMADQVIDDLGSIAGLIPPSIYELTTTAMAKFNSTIPDSPKVKYFSFGARFHPSFYNVFYYPWRIVHSNEGDNDGLVSVASAHWGKYLGTLENVDHLDSINWSNTIRNIWSTYVVKRPPSFNAVAFYLDIADQLAKEGF